MTDRNSISPAALETLSPAPIVNGLSFDIEDWFQVENLRKACPRDRWECFDLRVEPNTERILDELDKAGHKATFFILGWIAERRPEMVKRIAASGHEIACHGYNHDIVYTLTPDEFREDLRAAKGLLEQVSRQEVVGYRAPNFSITEQSLWAIDILKEEGFRYDSSIFPTSFHDRYGFKKVKDSDPFVFENGLREFPVTIYKLGCLNIPVGGGGYFRLMPYWLFKRALNSVNERAKRFIFYLHPWEIDAGQPRVKIKTQYYLRHYAHLDKTQIKLQRLLADFRFVPIKELRIE
ncbi:MAG: DUF3473 domain-containing protein [Candidatus Omnitrophica bacterium]|nr:DUF3473 domain-containing protein [Candidatus Omnitrophota bacterium]